MKKIIEISSTLFAYLKHPDLYPELKRKIWKNIFNRSSGLRGKEKSEKWCASLAISEKDFIENVLKMNFIPFEKLFPEDFSQATKRQTDATVKMGVAGSLSLMYYINPFINSYTAVETRVAYGWSSFASFIGFFGK